MLITDEPRKPAPKSAPVKCVVAGPNAGIWVYDIYLSAGTEFEFTPGPSGIGVVRTKGRPPAPLSSRSLDLALKHRWINLC